ncbi:MAG: ATP-binding protein [Kiritimatiellae bacterium]|nr:ATP-binding protein [Kiritimatiellia bacterium]
MTEENIRMIYDMSAERIRETDTSFHRYLFDEIDWDARVVALDGPRGVGKTTMFLQHLRENQSESDSSLYVSIDNVWLNAQELYELVQHHVRHGGGSVYIDEIHYLSDWQNLIKSLYDNFKKLKIAYTGSSILRLASGKADLSRRQIEYTLAGMSFREFLEFEGCGSFEEHELDDILKNHVAIADKIVTKTKIVPKFEQYLDHGYYPFYREEPRHFHRKLLQVVNQVLDVDLPKVEDVTTETIRKTRRMLTILAESTPQTPNTSRLCRSLEMDRKQGLKILHALRRSGLVGMLAEDADALKHLCSPNKLFCDNTNLMRALTPTPDKGTLREVFFNNQLSVRNTTAFPTRGDSLVDGKHLFEIGGEKKTFAQIKDMPDSYLAVDGIEVGRGCRIPLWLFGFLY